MKIVLLGNAGAGKSTLARRLAGDRRIPCLSLDQIAWKQGTERKPLEVSRSELRRFIDDHAEWIIEGCYGDLIETALPHCSELRFLNPGVEACVEHCRRRPWEPEKFRSAAEQAAGLAPLIRWVRDYETRDDDCGLERHRRIYAAFRGPKREYTAVSAYDAGGRLGA